MSAQPLETRLLKSIANRKGDVFLRRDFDSLGEYDQVGRGLSKLVQSKKLIRLGYGVYARTTVSPFSGQVLPKRGLQTVTEAVERLGVQVIPTTLQRSYNSGSTTQVPTGRVIGVNGRIRRKLGYNGMTVQFEYHKTRSEFS